MFFMQSSAGWVGQRLVVLGGGWGWAQRGVRLLGNSAAEGLSHRQRKVIGGWLLGCCGMVAGAVILGESTHNHHAMQCVVDGTCVGDPTPVKGVSRIFL